LLLADKINNCKLGGNFTSPLQGLWRIFAVDISSYFVGTSSDQPMIEELLYDGSRTFSCDWNQLNNDQSSIIDLMVFEFGNNYDTSKSATPYNETPFPSCYYCVEIVSLDNEN
jgi:hypothetical protein